MTLDPAAVDPRRAMSVVRRISLIITIVGLTAVLLASTGSAQVRGGPVVTEFASFGDGSYTTGSTIGPDGALYVTDGSAGSVLRVDRRTGRVSTYATGLPTKAFATDTVDGGRASSASRLRLVTLGAANLRRQPFGDPAAKRIFASRGGASPSSRISAIVVTTRRCGDPSTLRTRRHGSSRGGFLVRMHHNGPVGFRRGSSGVVAFGTWCRPGSKDKAGFIPRPTDPHEPEAGKVLVLGRRSAPQDRQRLDHAHGRRAGLERSFTPFPRRWTGGRGTPVSPTPPAGVVNATGA